MQRVHSSAYPTDLQFSGVHVTDGFELLLDTVNRDEVLEGTATDTLL